MKNKIIIAFLLMVLSACKEETYLVELTFCDNRKPIQIIVRTMQGAPSIHSMRTEHNVPSYYGYLNVCDIRTIKKMEDASNN